MTLSFCVCVNIFLKLKLHKYFHLLCYFANYKNILGDKALYYVNEAELLDILETFDKNKYIGKDLNCYKEYTPLKVMDKFKKVFVE